jgi:hypothetical protein
VIHAPQVESHSRCSAPPQLVRSAVDSVTQGRSTFSLGLCFRRRFSFDLDVLLDLCFSIIPTFRSHPLAASQSRFVFLYPYIAGYSLSLHAPDSLRASFGFSTTLSLLSAGKTGFSDACLVGALS